MHNYFETTPPPFITVEFDYFRIPREQWELMLARLKQMGAKMATVSVPWGFHALEPNSVDLEGVTNARRDLVGAVRLCHALGLTCFLKVGPYHQNELLNGGIPSWLSEMSTDSATEEWYKLLSRHLAQQQWPDGPITALEIKREPFGETRATYSEHLTQVRWPIWLRKHYGSIDELNAAYGTSYSTVSRVAFPTTRSQEPTPLEKDAQQFLAEAAQERQKQDYRLFVEAGWQIPIYPLTVADGVRLPVRQNHVLKKTDPLSQLDLDNSLLNLKQPIQVDPDPIDIGCGPVWASEAPIRADGSVRQSYWRIRQFLWAQRGRDIRLEDHALTIFLEAGGIVTSAADMPLKISVPTGTKPKVYRLRFTGELLEETEAKVSRGALRGAYLKEDRAAQIDLLLLLNDPTAPLNGFLKEYLADLLRAQHLTLTRCAALAEALSQELTPSSERVEAQAPRPEQSISSYTLREARRGLKEADAALRKALGSIGGLEAGFDTILRQSAEKPQAATAPLAINPDAFEGAARDVLLETGKVCAQITPQLKSTATDLKQMVDADSLTIEQYQKSYAAAVATAKSCRDLLIQVIGQLRLKISSEDLPLVSWRVHDQIQMTAESLRWGVLRGRTDPSFS